MPDHAGLPVPPTGAALTCLIVEPIHPAGVGRLQGHGVAIRRPASAGAADVAEAIDGCAAVVTRSAGLDRAAIDRGRALQVIANHGAGTDRIDVARASELRIPVVSTPHANTQSVAEHTMALVLHLTKRLGAADHAARSGDWSFKFSGGLRELSGKTIGIVGFGAVGQSVARMARAAFSMGVLVHSPRASDDAITTAGATRAASLETLLSEADVVSLHRPLERGRRHLLGAAELQRMKPTAILINTARGALVDEAALADALIAGRIAAAGLDVFTAEPLPAGHPLLGVPNALLTPHVAGSTDEALQRTALACADQIINVLAGRAPAHLVNPSVWLKRRGLAREVT